MPITVGSLTISPYTALYTNLIADAAITAGVSTQQGRTEIVLDFNNGSGLLFRDFETAFSWPISSGEVLYTWQPSLVELPEDVYNRATDWMDLGSAGSNYVRGLILEADTFGVAKSIAIEDELNVLHVPQESPINLNGQQKIGLSFNPPFVSHLGRIVSTDGVPWRRAPEAGWTIQWIADAYPELTRAYTPIMEISGPDNKFVQGCKLIADTANQPVTFQVLFDGGQIGPTFTGTFNGKQTLTFSWPPFLAHDIQLVPLANARIWYGEVGQGTSEWVFQPYPEKATNWTTEITSLNGVGWQHIFYLNVEYTSTSTISISFTVDSGNGSIAPASFTLPSTGGTQTKQKILMTPNKWKLLGSSATSSAQFYLYVEGMEGWVKAWGEPGPYRNERLFGGPSSGGAAI